MLTQRQRENRILLTLIALFLFIIGITHAFAHSWYPWECCSEKDCEPMAAFSMQRDDDKEEWVLPTGERVPFEEARVSPDLQFHWCRYTPDSKTVIHPEGKPKCFWAPVGGG